MKTIHLYPREMAVLNIVGRRLAADAQREGKPPPTQSEIVRGIIMGARETYVITEDDIRQEIERMNM